MRITYTLIITLLLNLHAVAQDTTLAAFEPLMGKTWLAEGKWGDGSNFKQEVTFLYDLNKQLVIARSKGFTNEEQTAFGDRNHGIRKYDPVTKKFRFWEFDVFGGVTEGEILFVDRDIIYVYEYGGFTLADRWTFVDERTYDFTVGTWNKGTQDQIFLKTKFEIKED